MYYYLNLSKKYFELMKLGIKKIRLEKDFIFKR